MLKYDQETLQIIKNLVYLEQYVKNQEITSVTCVTRKFNIKEPLEEIISKLPRQLKSNLIKLHYTDNRIVVLDKKKVRMILRSRDNQGCKILVDPNGILSQIKESKEEIEILLK